MAILTVLNIVYHSSIRENKMLEAIIESLSSGPIIAALAASLITVLILLGSKLIDSVLGKVKETETKLDDKVILALVQDLEDKKVLKAGSAEKVRVRLEPVPVNDE